MKYLKENRFWVTTGEETFILGLMFYLEGHFIDAPPHMPDFVSFTDDLPFSITLMVIGLNVVFISATRELKKYTRSVIIFSLLVIWSFYTFIFAVHDFYGPFLLPRYTTLLTAFIVFRIFKESMWGDRAHERNS